MGNFRSRYFPLQTPPLICLSMLLVQLAIIDVSISQIPPNLSCRPDFNDCTGDVVNKVQLTANCHSNDVVIDWHVPRSIFESHLFDVGYICYWIANNKTINGGNHEHNSELKISVGEDGSGSHNFKNVLSHDGMACTFGVCHTYGTECKIVATETCSRATETEVVTPLTCSSINNCTGEPNQEPDDAVNLNVTCASENVTTLSWESKYSSVESVYLEYQCYWLANNTKVTQYPVAVVEHYGKLPGAEKIIGQRNISNISWSDEIYCDFGGCSKTLISGQQSCFRYFISDIRLTKQNCSQYIAVVTPSSSSMLTTASRSAATVQYSMHTLRQLSSDTSNPSTSQKTLVQSSTPTTQLGGTEAASLTGVQLLAVIIGVVFILLSTLSITAFLVSCLSYNKRKRSNNSDYEYERQLNLLDKDPELMDQVYFLIRPALSSDLTQSVLTLYHSLDYNLAEQKDDGKFTLDDEYVDTEREDSESLKTEKVGYETEEDDDCFCKDRTSLASTESISLEESVHSPKGLVLDLNSKNSTNVRDRIQSLSSGYLTTTDSSGTMSPTSLRTTPHSAISHVNPLQLAMVNTCSGANDSGYIVQQPVQSKTDYLSYNIDIEFDACPVNSQTVNVVEQTVTLHHDSEGSLVDHELSTVDTIDSGLADNSHVNSGNVTSLDGYLANTVQYTNNLPGSHQYRPDVVSTGYIYDSCTLNAQNLPSVNTEQDTLSVLSFEECLEEGCDSSVSLKSEDHSGYLDPMTLEPVPQSHSSYVDLKAEAFSLCDDVYHTQFDDEIECHNSNESNQDLQGSLGSNTKQQLSRNSDYLPNNGVSADDGITFNRLAPIEDNFSFEYDINDDFDEDGEVMSSDSEGYIATHAPTQDHTLFYTPQT